MVMHQTREGFVCVGNARPERRGGELSNRRREKLVSLKPHESALISRGSSPITCLGKLSSVCREYNSGSNRSNISYCIRSVIDEYAHFRIVQLTSNAVIVGQMSR